MYNGRSLAKIATNDFRGGGAPAAIGMEPRFCNFEDPHR